MRLENMVWRMMPDQFDEFVHGGKKTRADVDEKLKQLKWRSTLLLYPSGEKKFLKSNSYSEIFE